ncbi:amino acid transporter heavy chain SLC3A2 [Syngnathoides biaculeatus]|uniref:amino acid transporter heavy chain SLC3A2 n=1 Tax=Syngnathoides biaculeatus TaxID=300417 RepID=UPI002ADE03F9|nr:amino acid transporter heavy chain SLC3A2 [Syngnathoides biaculeatus]
MPLNVGDTGYGSVADPGLSASGAAGSSETAALLELAGEDEQEWRPMSKEALEESAGGPGWRKLRCYLVALFWLAWAATLATAVAVIVTSSRPAATPLVWWQQSLFLQLQPDLLNETPPEGLRALDALCDRLPYFKSLGISALILRGLLDPFNATESGPHIRRLLGQSDRAGLKMVLDVCGVQLFGTREGENEEASNATQDALRFWLGQGVAGFLICDTDAAYTEKSLMLWRSVLEEFNKEDEQRIVVVKQTRELIPPLRVSGRRLNITLVDVVLRSVLPDSPRPLSAHQVAGAIETHLQMAADTWLGWTVGGKAPYDLRRLLLVLLMTLPGTPVVQYDQVEPAQGGNGSDSSDLTEKFKLKHSIVALFSSLSHNRAREEALLSGSFTFLPFNDSSNATLSSPSSPPTLAFLRSWGCVHFLVLLNAASEPHSLDPAWGVSLPEAGVFVASTAMDRLGAVALHTLVLRPREAVVVKLFEPGNYS